MLGDWPTYVGLAGIVVVYTALWIRQLRREAREARRRAWRQRAMQGLTWGED